MDINQLMQSAGLAVKQSRDAVAIAQQADRRVAGMSAEIARLAQNAEDLKSALTRVNMRGGEPPDLHRIENIPGRRIPFDLLVDIPINAQTTSVQQGTITISQEGPFVAVARYATFLSAYSYQVRNPLDGSVATFNGRSFGRYRPVHSAWDLNDGQPYTQLVMAAPPPGTGAPHVISPSNASTFRTMEPDFRIKFENAGSSFPRSNIEVPSSFWTTSINEPFKLGALDFFERGEVMTIKVLPLHANNPAFGNLSAYGAPNPAYPFLDSGWDAIEGVNDENNPDAGDSDPVNRVPNGILTIGFHGYRIVQPAGAGPY